MMFTKKFDKKMKFKKNSFLHFLLKHSGPKYFRDSNQKEECKRSNTISLINEKSQ